MLIDLNKMVMQLAKVDEEFVAHTLAIARKQIKQITIPKSDGKFRIIRMPPVESKLLQYAIVEILSKHISPSRIATAYMKGASIKKNAIFHASNSYFTRLDLKDFFPSIRFRDFINVLKRHEIEIGSAGESLVRQTCFDIKDKLSIGFPASPFVCNIVMKRIDEQVEEQMNIMGDVVCTRYSDDFIISSPTKERQEMARKTVEQIVSASESPKLHIHYKKTRKMSIKRGNVSITGIKILDNHTLTVHPSIKTDARFLLNLAEKKSIDIGSSNKLLGLLSYIKSIDPNLYNLLLLKYYSGYLFAVEKAKANLTQIANASAPTTNDISHNALGSS